MNINIKNELGHTYGPWLVIAYTPMREPSNGCVIWEIKCKCGHVSYCNGNKLRFNHIPVCPRCGRRV